LFHYYIHHKKKFFSEFFVNGISSFTNKIDFIVNSIIIFKFYYSLYLLKSINKNNYSIILLSINGTHYKIIITFYIIIDKL
jgi:hypothetical protein